MLIHCAECRDEVKYNVKNEIKTMGTDTQKFGFLSFKWEEKTPICNACGNIVYVVSIEKENNTNFKKAVKDAQIQALGGDESKWQEVFEKAKRGY